VWQASFALRCISITDFGRIDFHDFLSYVLTSFSGVIFLFYISNLEAKKKKKERKKAKAA
jgi:hypothetical protein